MQIPCSRDELQQLNLIDTVCDAFETELVAGRAPQIEAFSNHLPAELQQLLVSELKCILAEHQAETQCPTESYSRQTSNNPIPKQVGRYLPCKILGAGGFGTVYLARDPDLDRDVAVKVSNSILQRNRFTGVEAEARKAATLDHPAIAPIYDVGQLDTGKYYLVSKYVAGDPLTSKIAPSERQTRNSPMAWRKAVSIVQQIAQALAYAHSQGIVHRDLKPGNILIDQAGKAFLVDFGLSLTDAFFENETTVAGTPAYMSPEQLQPEELFDGRSDLFSLGVIFYELLTGRKPFRGESFAELTDQIQNRQPRPPCQYAPNLPRRINDACIKALAKSPEDRFATGKEFADAIHEKESQRKWFTLVILLAIFFTCQGLLFGPDIWHAQPSREIPGGPDLSSPLSSLVMSSEAALQPPLQPVRIRTFQQDGDSLVEARATEIAFHRLSSVPDAQGNFVADSKLIRPQTSKVSLELVPGRYLVVVQIDGFGFHEVFRTVPAVGSSPIPAKERHLRWVFVDGVVELPEVIVHETNSLIESLARIPAGTFEYAADGSVANEPAAISVAGFYMAKREVTVAEFQAQVSNLLPIELKRFLRNQNLSSAEISSHPVCLIGFDSAVSYAERMGLRLPTEHEYEFVATRFGRANVPWGQHRFDTDLQWDELSQLDRGPQGIAGLFSGIGEWTQPLYSANTQRIHQGTFNLAIVRGIPPQVLTGADHYEESWNSGSRNRVSVPKSTKQTAIGFRPVLSQKPRLRQSDF